MRIVTNGMGSLVFDDETCQGDNHTYPKTYAGDPQYAAAYFSKCLCGRKRKITTVKEVDVSPPEATGFSSITNLSGEHHTNTKASHEEPL